MLGGVDCSKKRDRERNLRAEASKPLVSSPSSSPPPSLPQVCRRWKDVLDAPEARPFLWREVVVDFGHELITAVHTPIAWSDARPSDAEFRDAFAATRLSAARVLDFVATRATSVRRVVLTNSEGYWSDEGDFVNLQQKHTFSLGHVGLLLGSVRATLEELRVSHCSDIFAGFNRGALGTVACCPKLKVLRIEDVHTRLERDALSQLGKLTNLEELAVSVEDNLGSWAVGLDAVPEAWRSLTKLKRLELRGHVQLASLPRWLPELEELEELDLSGCCHCDVSSSGSGGVLQRCLALRVVSLSGMRLSDPLPPPPAQQQQSPPPRSAAALFGEEAPGAAAGAAAGNNRNLNNNISMNPAMQPRALAAAVEAANAAAAREAGLRAAAQLRVAQEAQAAAARAPPAALAVFRAAGAGGNGGGGADGGRGVHFAPNDRVPAAIRAALDATVGNRAPVAGVNLLALLDENRGRNGALNPAMREALARAGEVLEARVARPGFAAADLFGDAEDMGDDDEDEEEEEEGAAAAAAAARAAAANAAAAVAAGAAAHAAAAAAAASARALPDLSSLPRLEALNLSDNSLTLLPHFLPKLGRSLQFLDLCNNAKLRFPDSLVPGPLSLLPRLRALDARGAHAEAGLGYWSEDKCVSMRNLCALAKAGKRRRPWKLRVFMDKE